MAVMVVHMDNTFKINGHACMRLNILLILNGNVCMYVLEFEYIINYTYMRVYTKTVVR